MQAYSPDFSDVPARFRISANSLSNSMASSFIPPGPAVEGSEPKFEAAEFEFDELEVVESKFEDGSTLEFPNGAELEFETPDERVEFCWRSFSRFYFCKSW